MNGYCALCSMEQHVRRCFKEQKSFVKGAAILPGYFTSNLKGKTFKSFIFSEKYAYKMYTALSKTLRLGRQEDAHEFYMFLLSAFQKSSLAGLG